MLIKRYNGPEKRNSSVEAVQTILSRKKSRSQIFSQNVENVLLCIVALNKMFNKNLVKKITR